ncbi:MAG: DUF3800 domain-containing protein [Bacillota bacterium]
MKRHNIYCDESCHLENDHQKAMALGAVWCPQLRASRINRDLTNIKKMHGYDSAYEFKWARASLRNYELYKSVLEYFFNNELLRFRAVVIPDKRMLDHKLFNQTHDDWYYKMYFLLINQILSAKNNYFIYIDLKDTCSQKKIEYLHKILCNSNYDFDCNIIKRLQPVHSHEINILQIADLFAGALTYVNRDLDIDTDKANPAKLKLVEFIRSASGCSMRKSTLPRMEKFNIMIWNASARGQVV